MLLSLSLILILGIITSSLFKRLNLPGLLGMIIVGIVLGPFIFNFISPDILNISSDIRKIALIVILTRAGLSLDIKDLKKVGRPAILLCFLPATFEIASITFLAPRFFHISYIEAAIMGTIVAAVSPAIVVPRMIELMKKGYGTNKNIPQLIMAGSSVDDVYVIVLFTAFMGMYQGKGFDSSTLLKVPISIILGLILGILIGLFSTWCFKKIHIRDTVKIMLLLSFSFIFVTIEHSLSSIVPISGLLAAMALAGTILKKKESTAKRLLKRFSKIWVLAEILLFVLVGATVDITHITDSCLISILLIFSALFFRILGVFISLTKTNLNKKERLFCSISYLPKATVQAAIGAIPLSEGVASGNIILTVAVMAILVTAPFGAIGIDLLHKRLLFHK